MKKLSKFTQLSQEFFDNLILNLGQPQPLYDYTDGKKSDMPVGYKLSGSIFFDKNDYGDDGFGLNKSEPLSVKVRFPVWASGLPDILKRPDSIFAVKLVNPVATVYGQWGNNISITITDPSQIKFVALNGRPSKDFDEFGNFRNSDK